MLATQGWVLRRPGMEAACWGRGAAAGRAFFERMWRGDGCARDWMTKRVNRRVGFNPSWGGARALLGRDSAVRWVCANPHWKNPGGSFVDACIVHNLQVLQIGEFEWNVCKNMEWQLCAAHHRLPGQLEAGIAFATLPASLNLAHGMGRSAGSYVTDEIFFIEVCFRGSQCPDIL